MSSIYSGQKGLVLIGLFILLNLCSLAQEKKEDIKYKDGSASAKASADEEEKKPHHKISLILSHAHVPETVGENGNKKLTVFGSWGFDYDYMFNEKWGIGLHNDIIMENFKVEKSGGSGRGFELERDFPIASCIAGSFKPGKHFIFILGAGAEFAKEGNLFLNRFGVEYGYEIPNNWEINAGLNYDLKWKGYDTFVFGFGISKLLFPHKKS